MIKNEKIQNYVYYCYEKYLQKTNPQIILQCKYTSYFLLALTTFKYVLGKNNLKEKFNLIKNTFENECLYSFCTTFRQIKLYIII